MGTSWHSTGMLWTGYVVKLQNNIVPNTIVVEVEPRPTLG